MGTVPRFGVQRTKLISVNALTWAECEAAVRGRLHRHHRRCRCRRRRRRHCRRAARVAQEKNCVLLNHACEAAQFVVFPKQIWVVFIPCPNFYVPFKTDDGTLLKSSSCRHGREVLLQGRQRGLTWRLSGRS